MRGLLIIYQADVAFSHPPEIRQLDAPPDHAALHELVGDYIELVPWFNSIVIDGVIAHAVAFCGENGHLHELPVNRAATVLWDAAISRVMATIDARAPLQPLSLRDATGNWRDWLVGPVVVLTGDHEFMQAL